MKNELELKELMGKALESEAENLEYIGNVINLITIKQHKLNTELAGENYAFDLMTDKGKHINYGDCLLSEANEIQDSMDWKHWKFGNFNKLNINTEVIDNFHFAPSVLLTISVRLEEYHSISSDIYKNSAPLLNYKEDLEIMCKSEDILYGYIKNNLFSLAVNISNLYLAARVNAGLMMHPDRLASLSSLTLGVLKNSLLLYMINNDMTDAKEAIDSIYRSYLVKNVLNSFRNNNGYKEGTYKKIWNGEEDNDVAFRIAANATEIAPEDLEAYLIDNLTEIYNNLK